MFKKLLFLFLIPSLSLFALKIDPHASSFSEKEKKRVDQYDFEGEYSELKDIHIDARKKVNVEVLLSGNYPALEKINFEGGFGVITGNLTGSFPKVREIAFKCTKAILDLDLEGKWESDCTITIACMGASTIHLPKDARCYVTVHSSPLATINNLHPTLEKHKTKLGKQLQRIFLTPKVEGQKRLIKVIVTADRENITFM